MIVIFWDVVVSIEIWGYIFYNGVWILVEYYYKFVIVGKEDVLENLGG